MRIWLARHGETDWNARRRVQGCSDVPLNAAGEAQARALGDFLRREARVARVYTSEMRRARATAQIVAEALGAPVEARPGLQEMALGAWEGHSWQEIRRRWPELHARWAASRRGVRPPGGETYQEVLARFVPAVVRIAREAQGEALIVTHSACMVSFLAELNSTPLETMFEDYRAPNAGATPVERSRILARFGGYAQDQEGRCE